MGTALRKNMQEPRSPLTSKSSHRVSFSASTEDTPSRRNKKRPRRNETDSSRFEPNTSLAEQPKAPDLKTTRSKRRSKPLSEFKSAPDETGPQVDTMADARGIHSAKRREDSNMLQASLSSVALENNPIRTSVRRVKRKSSGNAIHEGAPEMQYVVEAKPSQLYEELSNQRANVRVPKKYRSTHGDEKKHSRVKRSNRMAPQTNLDPHEVRELKSCLKTVPRSGSSSALKNAGQNVLLSTNPKNLLKLLQSCGPSGVLESRTLRQKKPSRSARDAQFLNHWLQQYQSLLNGVKFNQAYPYANLRNSTSRNPLYHSPTWVQSAQNPHGVGVGPRLSREPLYKSPWHEQFKMNLIPQKPLTSRRKFSVVDTKGSRSNVANPGQKSSGKYLPKARSKASGVDVKCSRRNIEASKSDILPKSRELVLHKSSNDSEERGRTERIDHKAAGRSLANSVIVEMDKHGYKISKVHGRGTPQVSSLNDKGGKPITVVQGLINQQEKANDTWRASPVSEDEDDTTQSTRSSKTITSHSSISVENLSSYLRKVRRRLREYSKKLKERHRASSESESKTKIHVESKTKKRKLRKKRKKKSEKRPTGDKK